MKAKVKQNRELLLINAQNTQNENRAETIELVVPEEYESYNKKIVFITPDGTVWDVITNNKYKLTNAITKYEKVNFYIWLTKEVDGESIDFRTKTKTLILYNNVDASDEITDEEIHGVNTVVNLLEEEIEKVENLNIEATKVGHTTTVTITKKDGTTESVEINDGIDGQDGYTPQKGIDYFTEQDIEEIEGDIFNEVYTKNQTDTLLEGKANVSDIPDVSSFITKDVNNLTYYTLKTNTGSLIDLEINDTTYVVTMQLKDIDGNVISTDTIDLPLESLVVGGSYDSVNKKIVLTLENGNTVDIPVGDLIAGLQTEITSQNKLASDLVDDSNSGNKFTNTTEKNTWNRKYDKPSGGIPKTDLASDVQTSLDKADTAIQEHQSLTDYVKNTDYATDSKGGVIKSSSGYSNSIVNGILVSTTKQYTDYNNGSNAMFISKGTLENVIAGKELINQTQLDNSQEIQDDEIEALQTENARLKATLPTTTGTGQDVTLDKTAEMEFKKQPLPMGNSEQFSTTGVQLANITDYSETKSGVDISCVDNEFILDGTLSTAGNIIGSGNNTNRLYFATLPAGTYTLCFKKVSGSLSYSEGQCAIYLRNSNAQSLGDINIFDSTTTGVKTFTLESSTDLYIQFYVNKTGWQFNKYKFEFILAKGTYTTSTIPDFEPYTGGQASPNPDYPQEITNVTGDVEVKVKNKNLIDYTTVEATSNTTVQLIDNGFKATGKYAGKIVIENLKPNTNYYLQYIRQNIIGSTVSVVVFGGTTTSNIIKTLTSSDVFNTGNNTTINIWFYASMGGADGEANFTNIQLEEGSTPTEYVGRQSQTFTFPLGNEKLMLGDYLADDGIHHVRGQVVLDGSETWAEYLSSPEGCYRVYTEDIKVGLTSQFSSDNLNCNYFKPQNYINMNSIIVTKFATYINIDNTIANTINNFKTWLLSHNVLLEYPLAEEVIVPYTSAQQTVYNQIKQALSYNEQTNISSNTIALFDVEAYQSTKLILKEMATAIVALGGV